MNVGTRVKTRTAVGAIAYTDDGIKDINLKRGHEGVIVDTTPSGGLIIKFDGIETPVETLSVVVAHLE